MIFAHALCLSLIAVAAAAETAASKQPEPIDMMHMVNVSERLVVFARKHTTDTPFRCQSAMKKSGDIQKGYDYSLKARNGSEYLEDNVHVTLLPLPVGSGYKSTYIDRTGTNFTLTLWKKDESGRCFVIFVEKNTGEQGCELLVTASTRNETVPRDCQSFYRNTENCEGTSKKLYKDKCKYD
uniref:Secreted protein n=1 Tax=Amblyomma cajennense TaxID=34607 RepID=A0A023FQH8_AMBCJ